LKRTEAIINTGKAQSKAINGDAEAQQSTLAHDLAFASVVAVILGVGILGGAVSPEATALTAEVEAARPSRETVYFPSQYVNQGREIPEPAPTF
jgi:lysozyme family protein